MVLLTATRELIYMGLRSNEKGIFDKYNTLFVNKSKYETLILGSSRAESHFDVQAIDEALQTTTYNLGIEGASLPFELDIFKIYLEKSSFPKQIILNLDYHIPKCDNDTVFMFPRFFPYLHNQSLYSALQKRDERMIYFRYLPFYSLAYTGDNYLTAAIRGFLNKPGAYDLSFNKGYAPVLEQNTIPFKQWKYTPYEACNDAQVYNLLDSIAQMCKQNNAKLHFVLSPLFYKASNQISNKNSILEKIKSKSIANNIPLFDYTSDVICNDSSLFADPYHLNKKGAELFTKKFLVDFTLK